MIRFKVVRGSHLMLFIAILVLLVVLAGIALQAHGTRAAVSVAPGDALTEEAKVEAAFASSALSARLNVEVIPDATDAPPVAEAQILIYHTHTHEAYLQNPDDPYLAVETWRTQDARHSVVRVGQALADALREAGLEVTHDTADYEQDDLNHAYVRTQRMLEADAREYDLCVDLHRDAWVQGLPVCLETDSGGQYAQLMLLVGRGDAYPAPEKPDYEGNLAFAQQLTAQLNAAVPGICRNVTVKQGRYNQHVGARAILVEVGHNLNTLEQALNSVPTLADAITSLMCRRR